MRGERPCGAAFGQANAQAQEGDVGRLPVGVGPCGLHVGALDQPDVHAGLGQDIGVSGRAQQIRLDGCPEPVGHATPGHVEHAREDRIGLRCLLRPYLYPPAVRQGTREGGQAVSDGRRVRVQREVREVDRQPDLRGQRRQRAGKLEVVLQHTIGGGRIGQALAEQVEADPEALLEQQRGRHERVGARSACDVARCGPPGGGLPARHALDRALQPLAGGQTKQCVAVEPHVLILSALAQFVVHRPVAHQTCVSGTEHRPARAGGAGPEPGPRHAPRGPRAPLRMRRWKDR